MVFNLLENHNLSSKDINKKQLNVFQKWRNLSYKNKITPRINEKIILLKPPHLSNISSIPIEKSGSFLSLRESNFKNYNILDYTNSNPNIMNNIYVNYGNEKKGKNKNHNVIKSFQSILQENINNVTLSNNIVYHKKKLCLSNNKKNTLIKSSKNNSLFSDSYNEQTKYNKYNANSFNISNDYINNRLANHFHNDRYAIYNSNTYSNDNFNSNIYNRNSLNTERYAEDIGKIKKINKIEEKEIFFAHKIDNKDTNNSQGSSSSSNSYDFKVCVTEHYNKSNRGNIDEEYSNTELN